MRNSPLIIALLAAAATIPLGGCIRHKVDPIEVTVNVNLRVDEELREFFRYENELDRQLLEQLRNPNPPAAPEATP